MDIVFRCGGCQQKYSVPAKMAGRRVKCQKCGKLIETPTSEGQATPTSSEPTTTGGHATDGSQDFIVVCPHCDRQIIVPPSVAGQVVPCPHCHVDVQFPDIESPSVKDQIAINATAQTPEEPSGIDGWLFIPAIPLVLGPFLIPFRIVIGLMQLSGDSLDLLETEFPGFSALVFAEIVMNAASLCFIVYAAFSFFTLKTHAPKVMIALYSVNLLFAVILTTWTSVVAHEPTGIHELVGAAVYTAIWIPYFIVSKRVRNTFATTREHDADGPQDFIVKCPHCDRQIIMPSAIVGKLIPCPHCHLDVQFSEIVSHGLVQCGHCGQKYSVSDGVAVKRVTCRKCETVFEISAIEETEEKTVQSYAPVPFALMSMIVGLAVAAYPSLLPSPLAIFGALASISLGIIAFISGRLAKRNHNVMASVGVIAGVWVLAFTWLSMSTEATVNEFLRSGRNPLAPTTETLPSGPNEDLAKGTYSHLKTYKSDGVSFRYGPLMRIERTVELGSVSFLVEGIDSPKIHIVKLIGGDPQNFVESIITEVREGWNKSGVKVTRSSATREIMRQRRVGVQLKGQGLSFEYVYEVYGFRVGRKPVIVALMFLTDESDLAEKYSRPIFDTLRVR